MKSWLGFFIIITAVLTACSVYESQGRKKFESNPSSSFRTQESSEPITKNFNECWVQPANEEIWDASDDFKYTIELISLNELQVCREER